MRAAVWDGTRISVVDDVTVREPGRGEVQVEVVIGASDEYFNLS